MKAATKPALSSWFEEFAKSLPSYGSATMKECADFMTMSCADWHAAHPLIPEGHCYGHNVMTKFGPLTFKLDLTDIKRGKTHVILFAKFWNTSALPKSINGLDLNTYSGKWNLHFGEIKDSEVQLVTDGIQRLLDGKLLETGELIDATRRT